MATIEIKRGTEGPKHDPYCYSEITVHRTSPSFAGYVTYHAGLDEWVAWQADGTKEKHRNDLRQCSSATLADLFRAFAGVSVRAAKRAFDEKHERRIRFHKCGPKHLHWVPGFPGEELLCCGKCHEILDGTFNLSAVE